LIFNGELNIKSTPDNRYFFCEGYKPYLYGDIEIRTGRNSSAPGGVSLDTIEAFRSKLLITLQQFRMQASLPLGALYMFIFCSSFCASYTKNKNKYQLVTPI